MNPGLRYLAWASVRGVWRRTFRRMRSTRGALTTLAGAVFTVLIVGGQITSLMMMNSPPPPHDTAAQSFGLFLFVFTLGGVVMSEAPFFWPPEVTFLFPAPLGRRETMLYMLVSRAWGQAFAGLYFALVSVRLAPLPYAPFIAVPLSILFIQATTTLTAQLRIAVGDRTPPALRRLVKPLLAAGVLLAGLSVYRRARVVGGGNAAAEFLASPALRIASLPLRPFAETFAATTATGVLAWGAMAALTVGIIVALAVQLPVEYRERSLVSSERRFAQLRRARMRRGGATVTAKPSHRRIPVPSLAFLGRAAPLARRQLYELGRGLNALLVLAFFAAVSFFYTIIMPGLGAEPGERGPLGTSLLALVFVFPLLASNNFNIDFRRDADRMAYLRSLPLSPLAVALGEVFSAAAIVALVNLLMLAGAAAWENGDVDPLLMTAAAVMAAPVAWLAVAMENWLFLLFPFRVNGDGSVQSGFAGRQLFKMILKLLTVGLIGVLAGVAAWLASFAGGRVPAGIAAGLVVVGGCVGVTLMVGRAFHSFDLTVDAPD